MRLFSIQRNLPTCLEIGRLNKNTNLCPGGVRCCEAFVADLVIMFSVLPIQTVFFSSPTEGEECTAYTIIWLCGVQKWITPSLRKGNKCQHPERRLFFSLSVFGRHATPAGTSVKAVNFLKTCRPSPQQRV